MLWENSLISLHHVHSTFHSNKMLQRLLFKHKKCECAQTQTLFEILILCIVTTITTTMAQGKYRELIWLNEYDLLLYMCTSFTKNRFKIH